MWCDDELDNSVEVEQLDYSKDASVDNGEQLVCVLHLVSLAPKASEDAQRHNLFRTKGTVKDKILDIIIDNGSTDNLISSKAVAALKLSMDKHPNPYHLGWIRIGVAVK